MNSERIKKHASQLGRKIGELKTKFVLDRTAREAGENPTDPFTVRDRRKLEKTQAELLMIDLSDLLNLDGIGGTSKASSVDLRILCRLHKRLARVIFEAHQELTKRYQIGLYDSATRRGKLTSRRMASSAVDHRKIDLKKPARRSRATDNYWQTPEGRQEAARRRAALGREPRSELA